MRDRKEAAKRSGIAARKPGELLREVQKPSALRTEDYFRERSSPADIGKAKRILKRLGRGNAPVPGDQVL